jgi:hypothetical protein
MGLGVLLLGRSCSIPILHHDGGSLSREARYATLVGSNRGLAHHPYPCCGARPACNHHTVAGLRVRPIVHGDGSRLPTETRHATLFRHHLRVHRGRDRQSDDLCRLYRPGCGTAPVARARLFDRSFKLTKTWLTEWRFRQFATQGCSTPSRMAGHSAARRTVQTFRWPRSPVFLQPHTSITTAATRCRQAIQSSLAPLLRFEI